MAKRVLIIVGCVIAVVVVIYGVMYVNRGDSDSAGAPGFPGNTRGVAFIDEAVAIR
jgi:hypothetical protein